MSLASNWLSELGFTLVAKFATRSPVPWAVSSEFHPLESIYTSRLPTYAIRLMPQDSLERQAHKILRHFRQLRNGERALFKRIQP